MTSSEERLAVAQARIDQFTALVRDLRDNPAALASLGDRLVQEHLERESEEIGAALAEIEEA